MINLDEDNVFSFFSLGTRNPETSINQPPICNARLYVYYNLSYSFPFDHFVFAVKSLIISDKQ